MTSAAMQVLEASCAPLAFEVVDNVVDTLTPEMVASFKKNKVALKGEFSVGTSRPAPPPPRALLHTPPCFSQVSGAPARRP